MSMTLQLLHIIVFTGLLHCEKVEKHPVIILIWCAQFYVFAMLYIWPHWEDYPLGIRIHQLKMMIDTTVALYFAWYLVKRMKNAFTDNYASGLFVISQSVILWLMAGLNLLAAVEFPFLKNYSSVYDMYPAVSHALNVLQLLSGLIYGSFITGVSDNIRRGLMRLAGARDVYSPKDTDFPKGTKG